jgi:putative lipoprotein
MPARQAEDDQWFGTDKVRHFFVSAMLQSLGYGTLRALDVRHGSALAGASVITAGFGIGKELSDRRHGRSVSARDLMWDAAGAGAASLLLVRTER